ncbi:MAG: tyrosine--tRNA ligase [Candidatus Methanoliparum thermophilum]|uniref:Tyrosine--tRNA ligase n=1 Tax=Methanoliparum thermophilum TaxID=2491083 RepID=A0A520KQX2_METT2|nr:MAG: tyrosine--tRNA ligase [Candidatus Methanoliparum thermophilum]
MDKIDIVKRNLVEIIQEEELEELISKGIQPKIYAGYEPSGKIHLGHLLTIFKLLDFKRIGFKVIVLLSDLHAYLNNKGSLEEIEEVAKMNKKVFEATGLDADYVIGSSFQLDPEYMKNVLILSRKVTLNRARRSMDEVGRNMKTAKVSQIIYPLMQVMDIARLDVDVALGGIDQRKIHMLAREEIPEMGFRKPICAHLPIIEGLDGEKMSSSKTNFIAVDDSEEDIEKKINSSFCPPGSIENNPIIAIFKYFIFQRYDKVIIERDIRYGGDVVYSNFTNFKNDYLEGNLHPVDLKKNAINYLNKILSPIREKI